MRVIVCGSRDWNDRATIASELADLPPSGTTVVHGGARGADRMAGQEAEKLGLLVEVHLPRWDEFGKRAGFIRNEKMASLGADLCIAFWDGRSNGTKDMMKRALGFAIPLLVVVSEKDLLAMSTDDFSWLRESGASLHWTR